MKEKQSLREIIATLSNNRRVNEEKLLNLSRVFAYIERKIGSRANLSLIIIDGALHLSFLVDEFGERDAALKEFSELLRHIDEASIESVDGGNHLSVQLVAKDIFDDGGESK